MKRLFFILLFFLLCLCGCQQEYGILEYQENDIVAECIVNQKYKIEIAKDKESTQIRILEPKSVEGITFEIGNEVYAKVGDTNIKVDKESLKGICALSEIFAQSEACLTSSKQKGSGSVFTFQKDACTYQITYGKRSLPSHVNIMSQGFEYDVEIVSIKLK